MKNIYALLFIMLSFSFFGQEEIPEISWDDLVIKDFEEATSETGGTFKKAVLTKEQKALDGTKIIMAGNYHVLDNFGSKTYLLSREEIIMHPMQRDEVIRLKMDKDPEIYFGRKLKISGVLHIDTDPEAETIYYITDVKKVKNTGKIEGED
ncbi:MAG: hypothetical protein H6598_08705 [Flavobacteriales bacterium]|nr:hypothetical protein [Flavobacteriales bacterium]MCB9196289.1 hypothetical protein [Flavobacteriales bacterium]